MKVKSPKITVLMSVYNGEQYLREAIDSILNQTYQDFEFVIINDASDDRTKEILDSYRDPKIIIINNQKNLGLTKSLNIGLKKSRGEYIARMDADDISLPSRLKKQKEFLDTHTDITCVGGETIVIDESGKECGVKKFLNNPDLIRFQITVANQMAHPAVMFRKSIVIENGGYDENFQYAQDYDLWSRLIERGYSLSNLKEPVIKYRYHEKSVTQGSKSKIPGYACATAVIRKNLSHYMPFSEKELSLFLKSLHFHKVGSLVQALSVINFLSRFKKSYLKKETISAEARAYIKKYIMREQIKAIRWYAMRHFGMLYKLSAKTIKFITQNTK